ncbi:sss sodium solute transporter superfamily protein [Nitritalea halalkaliphila LW7]|uniref:Sss sodium solute transporter superfamily protein n=1 Tax=Nitritalea halalkaliphila LW7 TaxID=1189621 RepID=I5C3S4_9BACT|nr:sodium:solute symporter [Nitritalea halalkaliphila]EIM76476.1 sss sodium solute transporter superfamily protein [Nitritalea halalkaliphila LW7]
MDTNLLHRIDLIIMFVYLVGMIFYGLYHSKRTSSEDYFLAGRSMTWPVVGISLFAANISSTTLIGLAGDAYSTGISVYNYEWMAAVILVFFSIFFLPFYLRSGVYTMPEFLERRYDSRSRYYFSFITLIGNVLIETAAGLYAGSLILKLVFPEVSMTLIIMLLAFAAAAYTIPGGLNAVVHTEVIQAILLLAGSLVLTYITYTEVGGWENVRAVTPPDMISLIRPIDDPSVPWTGLLFGVPLLGFYFWANNQFMVQRVLTAKDLNHGRWGALFAGLLKLPVLFFMVLPGTMARVLFPDLENADTVFPTLVFNLLPAGLIGLLMAGLLAAMSSSISATLNSASTLITMDFVKKAKPGLSSAQLVRVGQVSTVILVLLAAAWTPQIEKFDSLFKYLQIVVGMIAPPVVVVFIWGMFWKKGNANGAFYSLLSGFGIAATLITLKVVAPELAISQWHFLHTAPLLFVCCSVIYVAVSLVSPAPRPDQIEEYTWKNSIYTDETAALSALPWYKNYRVLSVLLLILTAIIVWNFR